METLHELAVALPSATQPNNRVITALCGVRVHQVVIGDHKCGCCECQRLEDEIDARNDALFAGFGEAL